jgi:hypothetical protein
MAIGKDAPRGCRGSLCRAPSRNSPELMPWDTSLNKDIDDCAARHVTAGYGLKEGGLRYSTRFSRHTLREQTGAYKRVMDPALGMEKGAPTSNRICQDVRIFIVSLTGICDTRGICVQGFGSRAGNCRKWPGKAWRQAREEGRNRRPAVPL